MRKKETARSGWPTPRGPVLRSLVVGVLVVGPLVLTLPPAAAQTEQIPPDLVKLLKQFVGNQSPAAEPEESGEGAVAPAGEALASADSEFDPTQVTVTDTGLIDLHARSLEISTLLELLSYEAQTNIVATNNVTGRVSANLYAVTLEQALDAVLTPNGYKYHQSGKTIFVGTPEDIAEFLPPPATRVFPLLYMRPAEAAAAVRSVLGADASVVEGGGAASSTAGGGGGASSDKEMTAAGVDYLIITDYPERLAAAARLLAEIDRRPRQVLIESTILRATLNELNEFGIDFTMLGGVDFQGVGSQSNASADLRTGSLSAADLQSTTFNVNTDFVNNITPGGFTFGLIKDSIGAFIRALEDVTDVVVVANPKIVALNKQEAEVIVGRRDGYLTTTVTETAAVQTVEFLETGTQIKFRPLINDDGTVRLFVHPKDSNGGLTSANLPFEETTEAQAEIMVKDGHTVLIGGLFRERTVSSDSQVPVLGDLPGIGLLFGSRRDQTVREEVIILLTVHVLKETEREHDQFRALLEDVERIRVGSRKGLLGSGRERLAQAYYGEALRKLEEGDLDRALLNARMTVNNQPRHLPALKLLERLRHERLWDEEGTRMRSFIHELIQLKPAPDTPPMYGRPSVEPMLERDDDNPGGGANP